MEDKFGNSGIVGLNRRWDVAASRLSVNTDALTRVV